MTDRYTRIVLTIIAASLVYLCIVMTAFPAVAAQTAKRPGDSTGPGEMVIVGWRTSDPLPITIHEPLRVTTERSSGAADRVVIAGWEENASRERPDGRFRTFTNSSPGLPVQQR